MRTIQERWAGRLSASALATIGFALAATPAAPAAIRRVNASAPPGGDGQSWPTAYQDIESAFAVSLPGDEIWVAAGTYRPSVIYGGVSDPRHKTFNLPRSRRLYGGFVGNETQLSQRNPERNETILSGDIGVIGDVSDNCYHVVSIMNQDVPHVLSGFTITGGNANGAPALFETLGAGIRVGLPQVSRYVSADITRCRITGNAAQSTGAGLWVHPFVVRVVNCEFSNNVAEARAGAVDIVTNSSNWSCDFTNCVFFDNSGVDGGAVYIASPIAGMFTNCTFSGNTASNTGGALYLNLTHSAAIVAC